MKTLNVQEQLETLMMQLLMLSNQNAILREETNRYQNEAAQTNTTKQALNTANEKYRTVSAQLDLGQGSGPMKHNFDLISEYAKTDV